MMLISFKCSLKPNKIKHISTERGLYHVEFDHFLKKKKHLGIKYMLFHFIIDSQQHECFQCTSFWHMDYRNEFSEVRQAKGVYVTLTSYFCFYLH